MTRLRNTVAAVVVVVLLIVGGQRLLSTNGTPSETDRPGIESLVVPGSGVIRWSPDATKLAFIVSGELIIVRVSDAKELGRRGEKVVDVAWMPDSTRVVVVEGPVATGELVAVAPDGELRGTTQLKPSIAFGPGLGLAINDTGTQAVAVAAERQPIGGTADHDLAVIDVQGGVTKTFPDAGLQESNPVYVDDSTVAYAATPERGPVQLQTLDLTTGRIRTHGPIRGGPYGVLPSGEVVVGQRAAPGAVRLDAVDLDGATRVLGVLPRHTRPVAIDRFGTRALVRRFGGLQGTRIEIAALDK